VVSRRRVLKTGP